MDKFVLLRVVATEEMVAAGIAAFHTNPIEEAVLTIFNAMVTVRPEVPEAAVEKGARAARPEWFGDSGKALSNYPGQDKEFQDRARKRTRAVIAALAGGE